MWFEWSDLAVYFAQFKSSLAASSVKDTSSIGSNTTSTTNKSSAISSPKMVDLSLFLTWLRPPPDSMPCLIMLEVRY